MQTVKVDATSEMLRAIGKMAGAGPRLHFDEIRSRSWASATFSGARHELVMHLEAASPEETDAFAVRLSAADYDMRGHIVADIFAKVEQGSDETVGGRRIRIEALTVEDD